MDILNYIKNNKQRSVMVVISISVLIGVLLVRKITLWLPSFVQQREWSDSLPSWFNPYGVAIIGLLIGVLMIVLINWTFRMFVKSLEEEK